MHRESLHDMERPIAMNTALQANSQRDPKKQKKAYTYEDFSFYKPMDMGSNADYVYGSAMIEMAKRGRLPAWALFCFKEVTANASPGYKPATCAFIAEDAMLLHPNRVGDGWEGMLIACESASEKTRKFVDDHGTEYWLTVPHIHTKYIAEEDIVLSR